MLSGTPHLRHVRSYAIIGQRIMGRPEQPVPPVLRWLRLLPIVTPAALAGGAILGDDVVAFLPFYPELAHAGGAFFAGAALAGIVFGGSPPPPRRPHREAPAPRGG